MMQAFNVYRSSALRDLLDHPRTFAFVDGLVVASPARVVSADPCGVVLCVERTQIAALERSGTLLIESPLHGSTYRGSVDGVDRRRCYASLSHLEAFDAYSERRSYERTTPGFAMLAKLSLGVTEVSGRVTDLSARALAADFDPQAITRIPADRDLQLEVWGNKSDNVWGEPGDENTLHDFVTTARINRTVDVQRDGVAACRVVLELDPYPALDRKLRRYIAQRQREVLVELCLSSDDRLNS